MRRFCKKLLPVVCMLGLPVAGLQAQQQWLRNDSIRGIMKKVSDWQWKELYSHGWKNDPKDWTSGAMYAGMLYWANAVKDDSCMARLLRTGKENGWKIGPRRHFADDYCVGRMYAQLYDKYKDPQYIADFKSLADTLVMQPHTEPLDWINSIYLREWAWCDALFMGPPALAYLSKATGDNRYLDTACELWWKSSDFLYSNTHHLFFRDSRYFTRKEKNGEEVFWSRGNGWVLGGLAAMLSVMPEKHPYRKRFETQFKQMCASVAALQQSDGTWHASLLDPASYPSKEVSGTGFFCYAMAWGIHHKLIDARTYYPVVVKAWQALVSAVQEDGKLGYVQPQGAAPEKVTADDTEVYGVGAFLLAGTEMLQLKK